MNESIQHIARQIKEAREAKGLSQRALSKKVGIPQSHISKIENGAVNLQLSSLIELTRVLGLELMLVPKEAKKGAEVVVKEAIRANNPALNENEIMGVFDYIALGKYQLDDED
jgi:transcriptional regulator with XRE-family HTH domain